MSENRALLLVALAVLALGAPAGTPQAAAQGAIVVVVNAENPATSMTRADVSRLFLRRTQAWPDGTPVTPYDLSTTSPVRKAFTLEVHRKPPEVIRAFWDQEIYAGRSTPPRVHSTEQALLHAVRGERGAVGYVSAATDLGPGLKVLVVAPDP